MPTCETCRFAVLLADRVVCRRYPPVPMTLEFAWRDACIEADRAEAFWPCTVKGDWCGEHQTKENTDG